MENLLNALDLNDLFTFEWFIVFVLWLDIPRTVVKKEKKKKSHILLMHACDITLMVYCF